MTQEQIQDYTLRITQANKTMLITILYDMTLDYLQDALKLLDAGDTEGFEREIHHADACIDELIGSLNLNYELAGNLLGLYLFEKKELLHGLVHRDRFAIEGAVRIFSSFRDAYRQVEHLDQDGPVMVNVPKVYAGLTYGRNELSDSVAGGGYNRGFTA